MTALEDIIRAEIQRGGAISFARFMDLALYHPVHGYYQRELPQTGRRGDFITSVSVGPLFGELLGVDFARRLSRLGGAGLCLVEGGAHDGQLADDLLSYLLNFHRETYQRLRYVILEPSERRTAVQRRTLARHQSCVRWIRTWSELSEFRGICLSNELLDAMPAHVFRWNSTSHEWLEWGVRIEGNEFVWHPLPRSSIDPNARGLIPDLPEALLQVLPGGFTLEVSPAAVSWWSQASQSLRQGWLLTADYGLLREETLAPHRPQGTLRAYQRHRIESEVLQSPGTRDLTAHLNFSSLIEAGENAGLRTDSLDRQCNFLKKVLERLESGGAPFPPWTPARRRQLMTLIHPEHLGRPFRILEQSRGDLESERS